MVAEPNRRDLVERVAHIDLVAATYAERRKEAHYCDRTRGTLFVPFALETHGALSARSDRFLVKCASLASRGSSGITSLCVFYCVPQQSKGTLTHIEGIVTATQQEERDQVTTTHLEIHMPKHMRIHVREKREESGEEEERMGR